MPPRARRRRSGIAVITILTIVAGILIVAIGIIAIGDRPAV